MLLHDSSIKIEVESKRDRHIQVIRTGEVFGKKGCFDIECTVKEDFM